MKLVPWIVAIWNTSFDKRNCKITLLVQTTTSTSISLVVVCYWIYLSTKFNFSVKLSVPSELQSAVPCRPCIVDLYFCCFSVVDRVTGGELFDEIVAREFYSENDARCVCTYSVVHVCCPVALPFITMPEG